MLLAGIRNYSVVLYDQIVYRTICLHAKVDQRIKRYASLMRLV